MNSKGKGPTQPPPLDRAASEHTTPSRNASTANMPSIHKNHPSPPSASRGGAAICRAGLRVPHLPHMKTLLDARARRTRNSLGAKDAEGSVTILLRDEQVMAGQLPRQRMEMKEMQHRVLHPRVKHKARFPHAPLSHGIAQRFPSRPVLQWPT